MTSHVMAAMTPRIAARDREGEAHVTSIMRQHVRRLNRPSCRYSIPLVPCPMIICKKKGRDKKSGKYRGNTRGK